MPGNVLSKGYISEQKRKSLFSGADSQKDNTQEVRSFKILMNEGEKENCDTNMGMGNCSTSGSQERTLRGHWMGSGLSLDG